MTSRSRSLRLAFCCLAALGLVIGVARAEPGEAATAGSVQKKAAAQAARDPTAPAAEKRPPDLAGVAERVDNLEKQSIVLSEDLGKARLDARTRMSDLEKREAEARRRLQEKIDALEAELAAEREKQARRNRRYWIAAGILALGIIASN